MKIKENKQFILYITVFIILSGLIGFYGGRYFERNKFRKSITERPMMRTGEGRDFGQLEEMRVRPKNAQVPDGTTTPLTDQ